MMLMFRAAASFQMLQPTFIYKPSTFKLQNRETSTSILSPHTFQIPCILNEKNRNVGSGLFNMKLREGKVAGEELHFFAAFMN